MKKILVLFLLLCLSACTDNKQPAGNDPEPVIVKEKVYVLSDGWIVNEFSFKDQIETYQLKDNVMLRFEGTLRNEPYCQDEECLIYDNITLNNKHLEYFENISPNVNDDYGKTALYNLNDELYLITYDPIAQYPIYYCMVFDDEGNVVKYFDEPVALTMNTEYQNMFLISWLDETGSEKYTKLYTANNKTLEEKDF